MTGGAPPIDDMPRLSETHRRIGVNIGDRQHGRLRGDNVLDVGHGREAIRAAIARALDPTFRRALVGRPNPYGDGHASERIADATLGFLKAR